jgi:hypothetical protein
VAPIAHVAFGKSAAQAPAIARTVSAQQCRYSALQNERYPTRYCASLDEGSDNYVVNSTRALQTGNTKPFQVWIDQEKRKRVRTQIR